MSQLTTVIQIHLLFCRLFAINQRANQKVSADKNYCIL